MEVEEYESDVSKYRSEAKAINYGLIYGMSATRLSRELKIPKDIAQRYMDVYFPLSRSKIFMEHAIDSAKEKAILKRILKTSSNIWIAK